MKSGFFISFEGGEGSGKSVQAGLLTKRLRERGFPVVVTREPGGTRIGEQIRAITHNPQNIDLDATTEAYLMAASRAQHVREVILPALQTGKVVVCDRFVDSSIAYQGYGRAIGLEVITKLNTLAVNGAVPDLTIILDVPVEFGLERRHHDMKADDRLDRESQDFYGRVRKGYLALAKKDPKHYVVIDATLPIADVAARVWTVVKPALDKHNGKRSG